MKKKAIILLVAIILFLALILYFWPKNNKLETQNLNLVPIEVAKIKQTKVPQAITTLATVFERNQANISSETFGIVGKILFEDGEKVQKGQILFLLNNSSQKAQYEKAVALAKEKQILYKRKQELYAKNVISKSDLDTSENEFLVAKAEVNYWQAELAKTKIVAPFAGKLSASSVSLGDYVRTGDNLIKLIDHNNLTARYQIPEKYLSNLQFGQEVIFTTRALPKIEFKGKVTYIAPEVNLTDRTVEVFAFLDAKESKLLPGVSGQVMHFLGEEQDRLLIPEASIISGIEGDYVFCVQENSKIVTKKPVQLGLIINGLAVIESGLAKSDLIVTAGIQNLREGQAIKIVKESII